MGDCDRTVVQSNRKLHARQGNVIIMCDDIYMSKSLGGMLPNIFTIGMIPCSYSR